MATLGEVTWASLLKKAGEPIPGPVSYSSTIVSLRVRIEDVVRVIIQEPIYRFRFDDFAVTSKERRTPKLQLEFARTSLGQAPVFMTLKVIWPCRFTYLVNSKLWKCSFLYDPKTIRFKILPQGNVLDSSVKQQPSTLLALKDYLPLKRLLQIAEEVSGVRGRLHRRRKYREVRHSAQPVRPSPEIVSDPIEHFRETQAEPYTFVGVDNVESYRRVHSGLNRTPGFGSLKANNLPVNAHNVVLTMTKDGRGIDYRKNDADTTWFNTTRATSQMFVIPTMPAFTGSANARNKAVKQLQERSSQGVSNIAVDVAEFRQFNRLIANTSARLVNSYRMLRRGNLTGATDALIAGRLVQHRYGGRLSKSKTLAQNWLELQYGWKPLLTDVVEGREALRQFALKSNLIRVVRSSAFEEQRTKGNLFAGVLLPGPPNPNSVIGAWSFSWSFKYKFALRFQASNHLKNLLQQTGFNNPISFGWELLPFSFVADWFLPIGPYLECLSANQGLTFLDGSETAFTRRELLVNYSFNGQLKGLTAANNRNARISGSYSLAEIRHNRQKLITFPGVTFPTFKNPLSVTHALNGIALLRALFK